MKTVEHRGATYTRDGGYWRTIHYTGGIGGAPTRVECITVASGDETTLMDATIGRGYTDTGEYLRHRFDNANERSN